MPTAAEMIWSGQKLEPYMDPEDILVLNVNIPVSTTIAKGTVLGELTATPGTFKAYATGNVDGSETAKAVMMYDVVSDAAGNIRIGGQATSEFGENLKAVPAYFRGTFLTTDLVGLDAAAIADFGGHLVQGPIANGIVRIP
jgi:hypothetical protein